MDERLKKIIDKTDQEQTRYEKELRKEEEKKRKAQEIENENFRQEAKIWVEENLFSLIAKADRGERSLHFSGYIYDSHTNYGCKIPAKFLIEEIKKIDGLIVTEYYNKEDICYDGPSYPAHYSYEVTWRPKKDNRRNYQL